MGGGVQEDVTPGQSTVTGQSTSSYQNTPETTPKERTRSFSPTVLSTWRVFVLEVAFISSPLPRRKWKGDILLVWCPCEVSGRQFLPKSTK